MTFPSRHTCLAIAGAITAATMTPIASAGSCIARSGPQTTALVELFTSEGCNSCPPADRWLSATFNEASATQAVTLAYHVDYWDRLGWKDRFASPAYTERQYAAMRANGSRFVYTPQVLVQGKDTPNWASASRSGGAAAAIAAADARPARAEIALDAATRDGTILVKASARIPVEADRRGASLYLALTQAGLASEVKAGENAGVRLTHDHVVRALHQDAIAGKEGTFSTQATWALPNDGGGAFTVVAFVQNAGNNEVLQALALPLSSAPCTSP